MDCTFKNNFIIVCVYIWTHMPQYMEWSEDNYMELAVSFRLHLGSRNQTKAGKQLYLLSHPAHWAILQALMECTFQRREILNKSKGKWDFRGYFCLSLELIPHHPTQTQILDFPLWSILTQLSGDRLQLAMRTYILYKKLGRGLKQGFSVIALLS